MYSHYPCYMLHVHPWFTYSSKVHFRKPGLPQTARSRKDQHHSSTHKWHSETGAPRCGPDVPRFPEVHYTSKYHATGL